MNKKAKSRTYLDILRFYSKDENQQGVNFSGGVESPVGLQSGNSFGKDLKKERYLNVRNCDGDDLDQGNDDEHMGEDKGSVNTDSFFRTLFCSQKVGSSNSHHYTSSCHRNNPFVQEENNNAHRRNLKKMVTYKGREKRVKPIHDEDKIIQKFRRDQRMRMLYVEKEHGYMKGYQKKMATSFLTNRKRKKCTICFFSNHSEHMEKCKNCSMHFHIYCYKMFRENFNFNNFMCDVCLDYERRANSSATSGTASMETSNISTHLTTHRGMHQRTGGHYRKYHFAYKRKNVDATHDPFDYISQMEESNGQSGSSRKRQFFKCLSEAEFSKSNDLLPEKRNEKMEWSSKRRAEGGKISTEDFLDNNAIYHRDVAYHSDTICNRKLNREVGPFLKKAKRQLKRRVNLEMSPEKITKMMRKYFKPLDDYKKGSHWDLSHRDLSHGLSSPSMLFQTEQSEFSKPVYDGKNIQYMHAIQYKLYQYEKSNEKIKCSICSGHQKNVLMIRSGPNLWFHVCCLYYNDISKYCSINHVYFEFFFLKFYNEDYFNSMYSKLKNVNEVIIHKIKQELLTSYNTTIHSHSFNFLMNPYYYNLTLKQIKNLIFYNFILHTNVLYGRYTPAMFGGTATFQMLPIGSNEPEDTFQGVVCTNLESDNLAEMNFHSKDRHPVGESSSYTHANKGRRDSKRGSRSRIDVDGRSDSPYHRRSSLSSAASSYVGSSSTSRCTDSSSDEGNMRDGTQDFEEGEYEDEVENEQLYVDEEDQDISIHSQNEHSNIYCIDTNNCTVVTEDNYYMADVLHIVSNHTRNETTLSVNKQNELNSFFKEIEKLIYKRDFIHLSILKDIKEKIQESVLKNHSRICAFCKKATGIKTKCMFPSCCTYFHISCYYEFFMHSAYVAYQLRRDERVANRNITHIAKIGEDPLHRVNKLIKRQSRRKKRVRNGIGSDDESLVESYKSGEENVGSGNHVDRDASSGDKTVSSPGCTKKNLSKRSAQEQPPIDASRRVNPENPIQYIRKIKRKIMDSSEQNIVANNSGVAVSNDSSNGPSKVNQKNIEKNMTPIICASTVEQMNKTNPHAKKEINALSYKPNASSGTTKLEDHLGDNKVIVDAKEVSNGGASRISGHVSFIPMGSTVGLGQCEQIEEKNGHACSGESSHGCILSTKRTRLEAVVDPLSDSQGGSLEEGKMNQTVRLKNSHHPNQQKQMMVLDHLNQNTMKTTPCKNSEMGDSQGRKYMESITSCSDVNMAGMNKWHHLTFKDSGKYPSRDYVHIGVIPLHGDKSDMKMHKHIQGMTQRFNQKVEEKTSPKAPSEITLKMTPKTGERADRSNQPSRSQRGEDCQSSSSLSSLLCSSITDDEDESSFDSIRTSDCSVSLQSKSNSISLHSLTLSSASSSSSSTYSSCSGCSSEHVDHSSRQITLGKWYITSSSSSSSSSAYSSAYSSASSEMSIFNGKAKSISTSLSEASNRSCRNSNSLCRSNSQEGLSSSCGEGFSNFKLGSHIENSSNRHLSNANNGNTKKKKKKKKKIKKKKKKKKYEQCDVTTDTEYGRKNSKWNSLGLFTTNVCNPGNSYLEMKNIKLTLCNAHNNEDDIRTVLNLKLNAVNNREHNNLGGIFYHYYNSFLSSVFFAEKFAHLSEGAGTSEWVDDQIERKDEQVNHCGDEGENEGENESGNLLQEKKDEKMSEGRSTPSQEQDSRGEGISIDDVAVSVNMVSTTDPATPVNQSDGETTKPSNHTHKRKIECLSETPNSDGENEHREMKPSEKPGEDDTDVAHVSNGNKNKKVKLDIEEGALEPDTHNVEGNDDKWRDEAHTEEGSSDHPEDKKKGNQGANDLEVTTDYENSPTQEKANGYDTLGGSYEEKISRVEGMVEGTVEGMVEGRVEGKVVESEHQGEVRECEENVSPKAEVSCKTASGKANDIALLHFMNYINRVIDNVEASVILKNNVCEGVYYLRQENGVNICQKVSGRFKKHLKIQNMKKKKKKKKKN